MVDDRNRETKDKCFLQMDAGVKKFVKRYGSPRLIATLKGIRSFIYSVHQFALTTYGKTIRNYVNLKVNAKKTYGIWK